MKDIMTRLCALLTALTLTVVLMDAQCIRAFALEPSEPAADCILKVHISTGEEDGYLPLANIILDIYKTEETEVTEGPSPESVTKYKVRSNLVATLMTDINGCAEFNFTQALQPDGIYLVTEQYNPAMAGELEPLYIMVSGEGLDLHLEKVAEKAPDIRMDVSAIQQKSGSFDIGQPHTWIIRGDVPAGICNAQSYQITDILDKRLDYEKGSLSVSLYNRDGMETRLEGKHYLLTEEMQNRNGDTVDVFHVSLTPDGMAYVAANMGSGKEKGEIRIRFQAAINKNTAMGSTIPNDAHLDYINSAGIVYYADSDIPEVHTGGIHILKTDSDNMPLAGSDFMIAREATQAEMENETIAKEVLHIGSKDLAVVYVDFYPENMRGEKRFIVTTDSEGSAAMYGLSYGTYYLVESKAPEGYEIMHQPMEIQISEVSHLTEKDGWMDVHGDPIDNTLKVVNTKFYFPDTGGTGTAGFTAAGIMLLGAACLLLLSNRNKRI